MDDVRRLRVADVVLRRNLLHDAESAIGFAYYEPTVLSPEHLLSLHNATRVSRKTNERRPLRFDRGRMAQL